MSSDGGQYEIRILITEQVGIDVHIRINAIIDKKCIDIQLRIRFRIVARVIHTLDVVAVSVRAEVLFHHALSIPRFEGKRKGLCASSSSGFGPASRCLAYSFAGLITKSPGNILQLNFVVVSCSLKERIVVGWIEWNVVHVVWLDCLLIVHHHPPIAQEYKYSLSSAYHCVIPYQPGLSWRTDVFACMRIDA